MAVDGTADVAGTDMIAAGTAVTVIGADMATVAPTAEIAVGTAADTAVRMVVADTQEDIVADI